MGKGIALAGNLVLDTIKVIPQFPVRHGLINILKKGASLGGSVNNTGRDIATLDPTVPIKAVGMIGTDGEGDEILRQLAAYPSIDTSRVLREGGTSTCDALNEVDTGARTFLFYGGANEQFDCGHVDIPHLDCDLFHIGYILLLPTLDSPDDQYGTRMARLLHDVQAAGILTSIDVVSEVGDRYSKIVPPALKYANYFIANELEAGKTTGIPLRDEHEKLLIQNIPACLKKLKEMGVTHWAVIHAPEGGFGMDEKGDYVALPSLSLPKGFIKGSVGAGDAFCAGVLYAAYKGETLTQAIQDGVASAACSLRDAGASEGMADIAFVRKLYAETPKQTL